MTVALRAFGVVVLSKNRKNTFNALHEIQICGYFWKVRQPTEGEIKEKLFIVGKKIRKWLFIRVFFYQFENCV